MKITLFPKKSPITKLLEAREKELYKEQKALFKRLNHIAKRTFKTRIKFINGYPTVYGFKVEEYDSNYLRFEINGTTPVIYGLESLEREIRKHYGDRINTIEI